MATLQTEIRKLRPVELYSLAKILSPDFWKILMGNIKKPGSENTLMFTGEHIAMIENAAIKQRRSASEIFLDEWGTMGRERPTIQKTINLLVEVELFRAADFLAVDVLKGSPPNRPTRGPAAPIEIPDVSNEFNQPNNTLNRNENFYYHLNATADNHSSNTDSFLLNHQTTSLCHLNSDIDVIEVNYSEASTNNNHDIVDLPHNNNSDLIQFSTDNSSLNKEMNESKVLNDANNIDNWTKQSTSFLPNFSMLMLDNEKHSNQQKLLIDPPSFPQELMSSELPLCINNQSITSTYQESSSNTSNSIVSSNVLNSNYNESNNIKDSNLSVISTEIINSHRENNEKHINNNILKDIIDYNELPVTVVEFCKN